MSLRTTSTSMPLTVMWRVSVLILVLHQFQDSVRLRVDGSAVGSWRSPVLHTLRLLASGIGCQHVLMAFLTLLVFIGLLAPVVLPARA